MLQFNENRERSEKRETETAISSDDCLRQVEQSIKERAIQCDPMWSNVIQCTCALAWSSLGTYSICSMFSEPHPDQDKASKLIHHTDQINLTMCNTRSDDSANVLSLQHPSLQCSQKSVFNMISTYISYCTTHYDTSCAHLLYAWGQASALKCPEEVQKANLKLEDYQLGNNYQKQTSNIGNHSTITWWHLATHYGLLCTCCLVLLANV